MSAFTLLELLVVVSIIGILAGLVLPAVQSARESARRITCSNNLHQIGLAISNYASAFGVLPQGSNGSQAFSLHTMILPNLQQGPLYNSINFSSPAYMIDSVSPNFTATSTNLQTYLCPSDSRYSGSSMNWTNYAGNSGSVFQTSGPNGLFVHASSGPIGYQNVSDGCSTTAALAEWVLGTAHSQSRDPMRVVFRTDGSLTGPNDLDVFATRCRGLDVSGGMIGLTNKGMNWLYGELNNTLYNHITNINEHSCLNGDTFQAGAWSSSSLHPGGVQVLFADSHCAYIKSSMSITVWRAVGSRNGNEIITDQSL